MSEPVDAAPEELRIVKAILRRIVPEYQVKAFGSRVAGCAHKHSEFPQDCPAEERHHPEGPGDVVNSLTNLPITSPF